MKKYTIILLFSLVFIACEYDQQNFSNDTEEVFYPSEDHFSDGREQVEIDLDSVDNYAELYKMMTENACEEKNSVIKFTHLNKIYNIIGNVVCPEKQVIACYMGVIILDINSETVLYNYREKLPVEDLDEALNILVSNPYNYRFPSDSLKNGMINFYVKEKHPIQVTKELLLRITKEFDRVNKIEKNKFPYFIHFKKLEYRFPPPPPPPPTADLQENN